LFAAAVGADNPAKQEIDVTALSRSWVVVDPLAACAAGGDLHHAIKANVMTEEDVHGELSAVVAGRVPARSSRVQVVFDSTGTALQDVAAAVLVYRRAAAAGAGLRVVLDDRPVGAATSQAR
jgi:ornithine cyclodeaminase/alanine dehydrogenase-like protein (mu-crystallin family)